MASRIEQIIDEIEDYIDGCKTQAFAPSKIIVNRETMEELLNELRSKTPDEIKRYQKIISNKEAILADAQAKADAIIAQAQAKTDEPHGQQRGVSRHDEPLNPIKLCFGRYSSRSYACWERPGHRLGDQKGTTWSPTSPNATSRPRPQRKSTRSSAEPRWYIGPTGSTRQATRRSMPTPRPGIMPMSMKVSLTRP